MLKRLNVGILLTTLAILSIANGVRWGETQQAMPFGSYDQYRPTPFPSAPMTSSPLGRNTGIGFSFGELEKIEETLARMKGLERQLSSNGNSISTTVIKCCDSDGCRPLKDGEKCRGALSVTNSRVTGPNIMPKSNASTPERRPAADSLPLRENPYATSAKKNTYPTPIENNPYARQTEDNPYARQVEDNPYASPAQKKNPYTKPTEPSDTGASKTAPMNFRLNSFGTQSLPAGLGSLASILGGPASRFSGDQLQKFAGSSDGAEIISPNDLSKYKRTKVIPGTNGQKFAVTPEERPPDYFPHVIPDGMSEEEARNIRDEVKTRTNYYRNKHHVNDLKLDENMNNFAQDWANELASIGSSKHRQSERYGENISESGGFDNPGTVAVDSWYNELALVEEGFGENELSDTSRQIGHLTQLLWGDSKDMGIGVAKSSLNGKCYIVANYNPPGNIKEFFEENLPKFKQKEIDAAKKAQAEFDERLNTPIIVTSSWDSRTLPQSTWNSPSANQNLGRPNSSFPVRNEDDDYWGTETPLSMLGFSPSNQFGGPQKKLAAQPSLRDKAVRPGGLNSKSPSSRNDQPISKGYGRQNSNSGFTGEDEDGHLPRAKTNKNANANPNSMKNTGRHNALKNQIDNEMVDDISNIPKEKIIFDDGYRQRVAYMPERLEARQFPEQPRMNISPELYEVIRKEVFEKTNYYRKMYNYNPLKLNTQIDNYAQYWANEIGRTLKFKHREDDGSGLPYGENLHQSIGVRHVGEIAVDAWYYETAFIKANDDESRHNCPNTGHLYQLLWRSSEEMGVGVSVGIDGKYYIVCNYNPSGCVRHFYSENLPDHFSKTEIDKGKEFQRLMKSIGQIPVSSTGLLPLKGWKSELYDD